MKKVKKILKISYLYHERCLILGNWRGFHLQRQLELEKVMEAATKSYYLGGRTYEEKEHFFFFCSRLKIKYILFKTTYRNITTY